MWTHWPVFQFVELIHVIAGKLLVTDELLVFFVELFLNLYKNI